jgi:hypothetical protein
MVETPAAWLAAPRKSSQPPTVANPSMLRGAKVIESQGSIRVMRDLTTN